jgi:hypothetical protein
VADASETSYPFATRGILTEEEYARLNQTLGHQEGVLNTTLDHNAPDLQVTPGSAGTIQIGSGAAAINGFYYRNSQPTSRSIPSNASGTTARNDTVVLECDQSANGTTIKYLTGGSTPPALTRLINGVWQMPIAAVQVPAKATGVSASNITDRRQFVMFQGIVMGTGDQRPIGKLGQLLYTPSGLYVYASTSTTTGDWTKVWPLAFTGWSRIQGGVGFSANFQDLNNAAGIGGFGNGAYGKYPDGLVTFKGTLQTKVKTSDNEVMFTLPAGYRPASQRIFFTAASGGGHRIDIDETGKVRCFSALDKGNYISLDGINYPAEA